MNDIIQISQNDNGDWYVMYRVNVHRGIRGKSKSKVDEVLIVGIPKDKFDAWCKCHGIVVRKEDHDGNVIEIFG